MAKPPMLWTHLPNERPRTGAAKTDDQRATDQRDAPFVVRHPGAGFADGVGEISRDEHSAQRDDRDGKEPEVPRHHETGELVEPEFGPLINSAFKRHPAIQINHDRRLRNVKEQNGEQPKEEVRLSQFRRRPDPA